MKAFVTGGTGFIGRRVVQQLIDRDYDVTCLVRSLERAADLQELGVTLVKGDITAPETMRQGMAGADVVFHCAGWYEVGLPPGAAPRMERINVDGTENVLDLAVALDVPRIVYTSTATALGNTYNFVVDETHRRDSPFYSAYDRTKHEAHQVAQRHIAQGAPVIIVMPPGVYGPGDHSLVATLLRLMLRRMLPVLPGADTGMTFVYVDDVAVGHVLAAEKGQVGQSYILGGDVLTIGDSSQIIARLAGVPAPLLFVGSRWLAPLRPIARGLERWVTLPSLLSSETLSALGHTWWYSGAKAEQELGYTHRAIEEGMAETVLFEADRLRRESTPIKPQAIAMGSLAAALLLLTLIVKRGRRE
jgi:nucleoside-diphosphate-sugar epimerase